MESKWDDFLVAYEALCRKHKMVVVNGTEEGVEIWQVTSKRVEEHLKALREATTGIYSAEG